MKFKRVFLLTCLVFILSLSSVFAASLQVEVPYGEPTSGDTTGYVVIHTESGSTLTYFWQMGDYSGSSAPLCNFGISDDRRTITVRFGAYPSAHDYHYDLYRLGAGGISLISNAVVNNGQLTSVTITPNSAIDYVYFNGNVNINIPSGVGRLDVTWGNLKLDKIFDKLEDIEFATSDVVVALDEVLGNQSTIIGWLSDIYDKLVEFINGTPSDEEKLENMPSGAVDDLESSQGQLEDDSDISSDLSGLSDGFSFGSISDSLTVVWHFAELILLSHPLLMTLLTLVLSLGVINLVLARR